MPRYTPLAYRGAVATLGVQRSSDEPTLDPVFGAMLETDTPLGAPELTQIMDSATAPARKARLFLTDLDLWLPGTSGSERHELISAAHTVAVVFSVVAALGDVLSPELRGNLAEQQSGDHSFRPLIGQLVSREFELPSVRFGFGLRL